MASLSIPAASPLFWYAVRVRSNFERETDRILNAKGYEAFHPFYKVRREWSDRLREVDLPLFPGYIFCRLDPARRLPVLTSPGVVAILGVGKTPVPVDDTEILSLQRMIESGRGVTPWPYIKEGQRIRITRGAMKGVEGTLVKTKGQDTVVASVTLLQRSVAAVLDRDQIEPIL